MKILAIICEFNPFHNGHKYLLDTARKLYAPDAIVAIMSGDFTQRGQMCVLDKYTRAKHAIEGGADCVIQLPSPFAVAPAEIFARGAIKILSSIPDVKCIAFGCESGEKDAFFNAAHILTDESEAFRSKLFSLLASGQSYIKSYAFAFKACGGDGKIVSSPNNILGLEYTKSIVRANADIDILPIKRVGSGYNDINLNENYSSASAIRENIKSEKIAGNVPSYVYEDLSGANLSEQYEFLLRHSLFNSTEAQLKRVYGCTEGLENKLKSLESGTLKEIIEKSTSKRYSSSRILRILCANALGLFADETESYLNEKLYIKPLAVKKGRAGEILSVLTKSDYPVITGLDSEGLSPAAKKCFDSDRREFALYNFINYSNKKDYMILV